MLGPSKNKLLQIACALLLVVASSGVKPACWFFWYQPKLPVE